MAKSKGTARQAGQQSAEDRRFRELREDVDVLAKRVDSVLQGEDWIQSKLYDLSHSLAVLARGQSAPAEEPESAPTATMAVDPDYLEGIARIREIVRRVLPRDATVIVVSKGDDRLLDLYGRRAWHFPRAADGEYLWYYPPDGPSVIAQLESLRVQGGQYLLFPEPAMWWLEQYHEFSSHLHHHYPVIVRDEETCVIFALEEDCPASEAVSWRVQLPEVIAGFTEERDAEPSILDWNTGLKLKESFPSRSIFLPPDDGTKLPYLDGTVDIVVASSTDRTVLREARRVAGYALVELASSEQELTATPVTDRSEPEAVVAHLGEHGGQLTLPSTSIIIPTHNGAEHLSLCLTSLDETLPEPFAGEVIVVDDGSDEEMQSLLKEWQATRPHMKVIRNARNRGFLASCNRGARSAKGEFLIFLNDDTMPQTGWLQALMRTFRDHPDAGAVGGKLLYPDGRLQEAGNFVFSDGSAANFGRDDRVVDGPLYNYVREVDYCSAALLATSRALFSEIGGFDKRFEPGYYEDTDYCFEVRSHGRRVYYQPESVVVHTEGGTGGTDLTTGAKRFQVVNQGKFARKWKEALRDQPKRPAQLDLGAWCALVARSRSATG